MIELNQLLLAFLFSIQGVESNHGTMLNHREISSVKSIHYGDSALGHFGMMPNTIRMLKKDPKRFETDFLYQKQVAKIYALKVLRASGGCPLTASILWLRGSNAKPKPADYQTTRYKRFVQEWESFNRVSINQDPLIIRWCTNNKLIKFN